jgi:hypothetical protein
MLNDIRKRLYQRSQPARTSRHSRWEKKIQLRRNQKEEQATEVQITIYETEQQAARAKEEGRQEEEGDNETQPHHRVDPRMAGADYATRRNGGTQTAIKDGITGTTKNIPQRQHAQRAKSMQHEGAVDSLQLPKPAFAD